MIQYSTNRKASSRCSWWRRIVFFGNHGKKNHLKTFLLDLLPHPQLIRFVSALSTDSPKLVLVAANEKLLSSKNTQSSNVQESERQSSHRFVVYDRCLSSHQSHSLERLVNYSKTKGFAKLSPPWSTIAFAPVSFLLTDLI